MDLSLGHLNRNQLSLYTMAGFYALAGLNHLVNPAFYLPLIPDYLPNHRLINALSGVGELVLGLGLLWKATRKWSAIGVVLMLVAFVPSHLYFIEQGSCVAQSLCVPEYVSWMRLLAVHPLLIWWAWSVRA